MLDEPSAQLSSVCSTCLPLRALVRDGGITAG